MFAKSGLAPEMQLAVVAASRHAFVRPCARLETEVLKDLPVAARDASDLVHWPCRFSFCTLVSSTALYRQMTATMAAAGFRSDDCEYLYLDNTAGNVGDGYRGLNRMLFHCRVL